MDIPEWKLELAYSCDECGYPTKRRVCASCQEYARIIPADPSFYDSIVYGDALDDEATA